MKVYVVMEECGDPCYSPHPVGIYSTDEEAKKYAGGIYRYIVPIEVDSDNQDFEETG